MVAHYLGTTRGPVWLTSFIDHGYIPVDIFLMLSGFVLALTYQSEFRAAVTVRSTARFLTYRLARIYPLYAMTSFVCLLERLGGVTVWGDPATSATSIAANLLLVQAWGENGSNLNAPSWSISTEWAANLLFPLFVVLLLRWRWRRAAAVGAGAFATLTALAFRFGQIGDGDVLPGSINWIAGPLAVMRCTSEFMLGIVCWRLHAEGLWPARLARTPAMAAILAATIFLAIRTWQDIPLVVLSCVLILGLAAETSCVAAAFGSRLPHWLGAISFSVYLWQIPLLPLRPFVIGMAANVGTADPWLIGNLIAMALVIGVSAASFAWLERPAQRAIRNAARRWFE